MIPSSEVQIENRYHILSQQMLDEHNPEECSKQHEEEEEVFAPPLKVAGQKRNPRGEEPVVKLTSFTGKPVERKTVLKTAVSHHSSIQKPSLSTSPYSTTFPLYK